MRRRVVSDNDDDFNVDLPPSPSKPSPRPRPTLNVRKPEVVIPKTNLASLASVRFPSTPAFSTSSAAFPRFPFAKPPTPTNPSPPPKPPPPSNPLPPPNAPPSPAPVCRPELDASLQSLMEQSFRISEALTEGSAFDGEPDSEEVQKVVQTLKDLS